MIALSIALVIISLLAAYLINKFLDQRHLHFNAQVTVNTEALEKATTARVTEMTQSLDERLNKTWTAMDSIKKELNSLKLQVGITKR